MDNLYDSKVVQSVIKNMTSEQRQRYKKIGESLYNTTNFKDRKLLHNVEPPLKESIKYIVEGLNSGLHPKYLTEKEVEILGKFYGRDWYQRWDYKKTDLPEQKVVEMGNK